MKRAWTSTPCSTPCVRLALAWGLTLILLVAALGCSRETEWSLSRLVPDLGPRSAEVLSSGTDEEIQKFYNERGLPHLRYDLNLIMAKLNAGSRDNREFLTLQISRLATVLDLVFDIKFGHHLVDVLNASSPEVLDENFRIIRERARLAQDTSLPDSVKIKVLEDDRPFLTDHKLTMYEVLHLDGMARIYARMGERDQARSHLEQAVDLCERIDYAVMECQLLGVLAQMAMEDGDQAKAYTCLDRMDTRARRSRLAFQAARAQMFRGSYARQAGQLSTAFLHYQEALKLCREFKGGPGEIRFLNQMADFYLDLGCWSIAEDALVRARGLQNINHDGFPVNHTVLDRLDLIEAEIGVALGRGDLAHQLTRAVVDRLDPRPYRDIYADALLRQVEFLTRDKRYSEALPLAVAGRQYAKADFLPQFERRFALQEILCLTDLGRSEEGLEVLAALPATSWGISGADKFLEVFLRYRLVEAVHGDGPELAAALKLAFECLEATLQKVQPSIHSYLDLQMFDPLRWKVHDLLSSEPELGYRFDLVWRGLARVARVQGDGGGMVAAPNARTMVLAWLEARGELLLPVDDFQHLLFVVTDSAILRWHRDGQRTVRERVDLSPTAMRSQVSRALAILTVSPSEETGGSVSLSLQDGLSGLAVSLLPHSLLAELHRPEMGVLEGVLWVSGDDALTQLPFAALDLDAGPLYEPLNDRMASGRVRYLSSGHDFSRETREPMSLLVADPHITPSLKIRLGGLEGLPGARMEVDKIARIMPGTILVEGWGATKAHVLAYWENVEHIYVAAHVVRESQTPYLSMIPLAQGKASNQLDDLLLEPRDILAADLSRCDLVILSGCSSGSPYREGTRLAPGLGEVFLDAGCAVAIQTGWQVSDQVSAQLMIDCMGAAKPTHDPEDIAQVLAQGKRTLSQRGDRYGHPFYWAAYSMTASGVKKPAAVSGRHGNKDAESVSP